ncbi:MAG TPA: GNAT family N-acetyltransferase [Casimicrobiaceae bacterium]|jgi:predicted acetyltransferase|nr:GNAT family N-acetyltransferase [Casimicrobiaceae bacterium]
MRLSRPPRLRLVRPGAAYLRGYVAALARGWSADTERGEQAASEELARIELDAKAFLASQDDREAKGPPIKLPDGSLVRRLPGFYRWMWDGEFAGSIALRWQPGTTDLPEYCLGHIGYGVVPWKRRRGYATRALTMLLPLARQEGLAFVEITTDVDNIGSQRVIIANGGVLTGEFVKPAAFGRKRGLRYRIHLA